MAYFDEEGKEVEGVLSPEEVEAQKTQALEDYKKDNPGDEAIKTQLQETQDELAKELDKEKNFSRLREKAKAAGVELEERDEKFSKLEEDTRNEIAQIRNEVLSSKRTDKINELSDDIEERKLIKYHLDRLSKSDDDAEAFDKNLGDAYFLATKQEMQVPDYISSAGAGNTKNEEVAQSEKELGDNLGITEEDRKKYK